ncbi:MAG TPA: helix-turn-helix domain-containing protein, partial [Candidatus Methylomirabilis sp.]
APQEQSPEAGAAGRASDLAAPVSLAAMEKSALLAALERAKGNKAKAAAALGITRTQLYTRLRRFGLPL